MEILKKLVQESKILYKFENTTMFETEIEKNAKILEFILEKKFNNLINIFSLDNDDSSQDIELAIFETFLKCN